MASNYIAAGERFRVTLTGTVAAGDIHSDGRLFGVYLSGGDADDVVSVARLGVWSLPKDDSEVEQGDALYYVAADDELTNDKTLSELFVGYAYVDAGTAETTVQCLLQPPKVELNGGQSSDDYLDLASGQFRGVFDVGASGKAIGTHEFGPELPDNAIIVQAWYKVVTTFEDADDDSATIALGVKTDDAAGLVAAAAISAGGNVWDAGGVVDTIADGAGANATTQTAAAGRKLVAVVADDALEAGKLIVWGRLVIAE